MAGIETIAAIASVAGTAMSFMGNMQAAVSAKQAAQAQKQQADFQAAQMAQQAGQEQAAAQRKAADQTRQANMLASRAIAVAGAGGGGVTDPTVANLIADIQGEGAYRKGVSIYQGEENARQLKMGASAKTYEGDIALQRGEQQASAYRTKAFAGAAMGASSIYGKFGGGGPSPTYQTGGYSGSQWSDGQ